MKSSRARRFSFAPLLTLAGVGLAVFGLARRRDPQFFSGKAVILAGGSRGLGLAMARLLHAEGARLALLARDADELDRARRDLTGGNGASSSEILTVPCDLAQPDQIKAAIAQAAAHFGGVDVLINNAGTIQVGPLQNQACRISRKP